MTPFAVPPTVGRYSPLPGHAALPADALRAGATAQRLRDQVQGALLGLMAAPTATAVYLKTHSATITADSTCHYERDLTQMAAVIAHCYQRWQPVSSFLQSTATGVPALRSESSQPALGHLLGNLPFLLRYHNRQPSERHQLMLSMLGRAGAEADPALTAQHWLLGDVLAWALGNWQPQPIYHELPPAYHHHYQGLWNAVLVELSRDLAFNHNLQDDNLRSEQRFSRNLSVYSETLTVEEHIQHHDVILGIANAIAHPRMYCLHGRAALIAGLVAGTLSGRSALPVLWQRKTTWQYRSQTVTLNPADGLTIANDLLDCWAGGIAGQKVQPQDA